jgi:hypothetical protein
VGEEDDTVFKIVETIFEQSKENMKKTLTL